METERPIPTIDDLINLPQLGDAQISPNGRFVVYTVSTPDWKNNSYLSQLWLVNTEGEPKPRQLTFTKQSSSTPRWSADGEWLAFLSKRNGDKATQIYRFSPSGGEAERLTEIETNVQGILWSPDGRFIAYTTTDVKSEADKKREETYGSYQVEDEDHTRSHLWLLQLSNKKCRKLTSGRTFHVVSFDWSPDSQTLIFQANPTPDAKDWDKGQIYTVHTTTMTLTNLTPVGYRSPYHLPGGTQVACMREGETYFRNSDICLISTATGEIQVVGNPLDEEMWLQTAGPDGLYFAVPRRTDVHLFYLNLKTLIPQQISPKQPEGWVSLGGTFTADFTQVAVLLGDATHYTEVAVLNTADGSFRRLTQYSEQVNKWNLPQPETFEWHSLDGSAVEGVLTKPTDFDPQKKYPLLVVIHGGPTWVSLRHLLPTYDRRLYPLQQWLAKGAIILQPNYRGSIGYGGAFKALNFRNLGVGDYEDVISGVDALIAEGWVDPERVAAMGWSQGGYISAFITTYSDRFKATSVGAGISNWMTYYVNTDVHPFTRYYLENTPWDDPEIYAKTSPMSYIKRAKTPTLIQHGANDTRVPAPNALELYQGLQDMNVPVRLVTYPGMPHGPNKPRQSRQIMQDNLEWFNQWVFGEPTQKKEERPCYLTLATFTPTQQTDVQQWARRDGADFRLLGAGGLHEDGGESGEITAELVSALAPQIAEQLKQSKWPKLVLYIGDVKKQPALLIALGCLQVAAGLAGHITIQHQEVTEEGWK